MIRDGLEQTASLWPEVREGFALLQEMAAVLDNKGLLWGHEVHVSFEAVVGRMRQSAARAEACGQKKLSAALEHFVKVSASYKPGLFYCYDAADVPATNNDLEQLFGSFRHHNRRVTGQKKGSASLVLRGGVRVVALLATRLRDITAEDLIVDDPQKWQRKRKELEQRRHKRALQMQFRRDPVAYLKRLEDLLEQANEQDKAARQTDTHTPKQSKQSDQQGLPP